MKYLSKLPMLALILLTINLKSQPNYKILEISKNKNDKIDFIKIEPNNNLAKNQDSELIFLKNLNKIPDQIS